VKKRCVLDTSALLAFMESEPGDERVEFILRNENVFIPWPALTELMYITIREKGDEDAELRYAMLKNSGATILWQADEPLMLTAAGLKAAHRISFADALIAAYAIQSQAILVHKDPEMELLTGRIEMEILPYKV
jgi:predicted nucleic acid-binding protein